MKSNAQKQYTIRNVSQQVDHKLRRLSREEGKGLNEVALEALERGAGVAGEPQIYTDPDSLIGSWNDDPSFDEAIRQQKVIDPKLWS